MTPGDGGPLAGLRVLDLADASGAFAGRLLAALGADVVLVEPPAGHALRRLPPFVPGADGARASLAFQFYQTGKRSVVADRSAAAGRAFVERLAAAAHAVVTTDAPAGARALAARHPHAVVASITPFGHQGPFADWLATDTTLQAMGGLAFVNGHPDGPPLRALGLQAHHQAGTLAAIGALAELLGGPAGRGPRLVDVAIRAAVTAALEHVPDPSGEGPLPRRQGTLHWTRAFRAGRCRDGWVLHSIMGDWTSLAAWVADELGEAGAVLLDPRWDDAERRLADAEAIFDVLDRWAAARDVRHVVDGAQLRRLPYAALAPPESLAAHPQLRARRFFADIAVPGGAVRAPVPAPPFLLDGERLPVGATPRLGEHLQEVEREWLGARAAPAGAPRAPGSRPLAGIRVLDFTWVVAGPVATRVLADLGARVVKVEHPWTSAARERGGGVTGALMRGKERVVLDLRREDARAAARDLALRADVVADNFSARVMPQLGLDAATLRAARPALVCLGMSGYGATGPWADRVSYGPTLQAEAGFTLAMRHPDGPPAGLGHSYSDVASGHLAALAVLASLWRRRRTGAGASIDFAQLEAIAGLVGPVVAHGALTRAPAAPLGNASQEGAMAPHGIYRAAGDDRWVAIAVRDDGEWRELARAMERPDLAKDARYATADARLRASAALDTLVTEWTRVRSARESAERLQRAGVPAGWVADARDLHWNGEAVPPDAP